MKVNRPGQAILLFFALLITLPALAQKKPKPGKYPSLLWEITGNGMKKPSYLFGTMHVSSKLAFHLGDSFYVALNNVDVVAIETKPDIWQQKLFETDDLGDFAKNFSFGFESLYGGGASYLKKGSLAFGKSEKGIEVALSMEPAMVNNLLYRSYDYNNDFEEDTYLDMYIYQIGCKLKKQVTGVEDYEESEKIVEEAYEDMYKEKNKKKKSYDYQDVSKDEHFNLNDAYRTGDLDMLDSINRMNSTSDAFDEKFLYKRNEIQVRSADSIMKIHPLFVGVGAAHLPGARGVIEMLRKKGYILRPIKMGERDGKQKDRIENIRVPVTFNMQASQDSFFHVMTPGKLYKADNNMISRSQYADMRNGSYYVVTRLKTNGPIWGQSADKTMRKVDSLLYENVPGKILKKEPIVKNGYKGYNIVNRTRKGDMQRYNIFVTPFEVIFFKISGTGDYISKGDEADKFFNSIVLQPVKSVAWTKYEAPKGGFSVDLPQTPTMWKEDNATPSRWQFDAFDNSDGSNYLVMRTDIQSYSRAGEDTFDLELMNESFASSDFIERTVSHTKTMHKGYPALDCIYKHKDSSISKVRFILQRPHYYSLVAHGKKETESFNRFTNSFNFTDLKYGPSIERRDTLIGFTVKSPVYPDNKTDLKAMIKKIYRRMGGYGGGGDDIEEKLEDLKDVSMVTLSNDTTGEKAYISFVRSPKYNYDKDTAGMKMGMFSEDGDDSLTLYRKKNKYTLPNGTKVFEAEIGDSASSSVTLVKYFTKDGYILGATAMTDTLTKRSSFLTDVFSTLMPSDTIKSTPWYTKKTNLFFADYFSNDSLVHKKALKSLRQLYVDSSDVPNIQKAISSLKWGDKDYLELKAQWIGKLEDIKRPEVTDYLVKLYRDAGDTTSLQNTILGALLTQETSYSYKAFKDLFLSDPPAVTSTGSNNYNYGNYGRNLFSRSYTDYDDGDGTGYFSRLYDSLSLTNTIFPELLPLINVDDYKDEMMDLLADMVDSNYVKAKDYEPYFSKIYLEAKSQLKKQQSGEKEASLQKAIKAIEEKNTPSVLDDYSYDRDDDDDDNGNAEIILSGRLMMPYWDKNQGVPAFFAQLMNSKDKRLKYDAAMLMLRNKKAIPDTMLSWYAGMENYRYELYKDLKEMKMLDKFPAEQRNLLSFAKAILKEKESYSAKADTLVYLDKYHVDYKRPSSLVSYKGWVYYFKYKEKKDDTKWKIATVGLMPDVVDSFFVPKKPVPEGYYLLPKYIREGSGAFYGQEDPGSSTFTSLSGVSINEDEPLEKQLKQHFKEMVYSLHPSASEFYGEEYDWFRNSMLGLSKGKYGE